MPHNNRADEDNYEYEIWLKIFSRILKNEHPGKLQELLIHQKS